MDLCRAVLLKRMRNEEAKNVQCRMVDIAEGEGSEVQLTWTRTKKRWWRVCQTFHGIKRSEDLGS